MKHPPLEAILKEAASKPQKDRGGSVVTHRPRYPLTNRRMTIKREGIEAAQEVTAIPTSVSVAVIPDAEIHLLMVKLQVGLSWKCLLHIS